MIYSYRQVVGNGEKQMRVVKEAEERRNEILDVAERLFSTKGFEQTSTNDILLEIGIARGTLYYHFKSKEDILDAVIARITKQLLFLSAQVAQDKGIPVLERLTKAIIALNVNSSIGQEITSQLHKPQNALLHQKLQTTMIAGIVPILTKLMEEGAAQGILQTDYPQEAVEMLMVYSNEAFDDLNEQTAEQKQQKIEGFIYNAERMLGMKKGSLQRTIRGIFENQQEDI